MTPESSLLAEQHVVLARQCASKMAAKLPPHIDVDELEGVAMEALIDAANKYDPSKCDVFGGFFASPEGVEHVQAYWPEDAVAQGEPVDPDWRRVLAMNSQIRTDEVVLLCELAMRAVKTVDGGSWSVDFLQALNGGWYLTDMAEADRSFRYEGIARATETARLLTRR